MHEFEEFTFFWDGPFSQWEPCYFEIEDVEYNCAEQFMMAEKARLFGDEHTLEMIMETDVPGTQKALGRQVAGFSKAAWEDDDDTENGRPYCWNIVWRGNMAKFSQNSYLLDLLLATDGTTLVEASPEDHIWGIGLAEGHPGCYSRDTWQGLNWLGEVLTNVREHLKHEL
ncbi:MAG: NADAR family protein [Planctomycetales bacterium]|nr:NADAR family protein [Planctomycetales bacterium]